MIWYGSKETNLNKLYSSLRKITGIDENVWQLPQQRKHEVAHTTPHFKQRHLLTCLLANKINITREYNKKIIIMLPPTFPIKKNWFIFSPALCHFFHLSFLPIIDHGYCIVIDFQVVQSMVKVTVTVCAKRVSDEELDALHFHQCIVLEQHMTPIDFQSQVRVTVIYVIGDSEQ